MNLLAVVSLTLATIWLLLGGVIVYFHNVEGE